MKYDNVGTIEFLSTPTRKFYFLEMNTRIQVEHPVTEMVTGIDLVREQIRIADGREAAVRAGGHPPRRPCHRGAHQRRGPRTFLPCPGPIDSCSFPGGFGVRIDTAIYPGYVVPPTYDSLIGKLIVHGEDRNEAIMRMRRALDEIRDRRSPHDGGFPQEDPRRIPTSSKRGFRRISSRSIVPEFGGTAGIGHQDGKERRDRVGFLDSIKKAFSSQENEDRASMSRKVQTAPNDPQARQKLGIFLMRAGEVVEGLDQLARAAVIYEKDGFAGKAIAVLRQMLKHDPKNNDFQKWLIRLLAAEGLSADAQTELRKISGEAGRFTSDEQRLDFFRQMAEYMRGNPLPHLYIADIYRGQKKMMEAVTELTKAVRATVASGMYAEFTERLRAVATQPTRTCRSWSRAGSSGYPSGCRTRASRP